MTTQYRQGWCIEVVLPATKTWPKASAHRMLHNLDLPGLDLVHPGDPGMDQIGEVLFYDPLDEPEIPCHALVLGVGLRDSGEIADLLSRLGQLDAAGLVLRDPVSRNPAVIAAADSAGVTLLGLARGASWNHVAAFTRTLLNEERSEALHPHLSREVPDGDLFALASAIADLVAAPVTIEDRNSCVLAFSGSQEEADATWIETIIGRRVPRVVTKRLLERGVFGELYRSDAPIWVVPDPTDDRQLPRVAIAIKAGEEVLGSIWIAVRDPLSDARNRALRDAARVAALHILRVRANSNLDRRMRTHLLRTALQGGDSARQALNKLGLSKNAVALIALTLLDPSGTAGSFENNATLAAERQRISDGFALHLGAAHQRSVCALVDDVTYGLLPVAAEGHAGEERATEIAQDFLDRTGHREAVVAVGPIACGADALARARETTERVLRVLRDRQCLDRRVARLADVHADALVLEIRDIVAARGDAPTGSLARLLEHDSRHGSNHVETLRAWLDASGDINEASAAVYVHPNTFRYRLRRISEIGSIDLADSDARFSAMLQLRVLLAV